MAVEPIIAPPLNSPATILVDWLELIAFFNEFGLARLDVLQGALTEQEEEPEENIGRNDRENETIIDRIENEVIEREKACNGSYPFELSDDAEELSLKAGWDAEEHSVYFVCLLTSHLTTNSLFDFRWILPLLLGCGTVFSRSYRPLPWPDWQKVAQPV